MHVVGVPKTIDNDLNATDYTFGFDTAVNIATEAIDRLHTTAESHHRALVVEVMGRHAGWIALHSGHGRRRQRHPHPRAALRHRPGLRLGRAAASRRHYAPIVVVAEGAMPRGRRPGRSRTATLDAFGHVRLAGIGEWLAKEIEKRTGKEARTTVLGHIQRGGTPTAFDRWLATRFGLHAIDAVHEGDWGKMVALRGADIVRVPLADGDDRAQDGRPVALRRGRGLLRLTWPSRPGNGPRTVGTPRRPRTAPGRRRPGPGRRRSPRRLAALRTGRPPRTRADRFGR